MRRALIALLLVALCFVALEGAVRVLYGLRGKPPPHADESTRNEWRWAMRHLEAGEAVLPGVYEYHPLLGWAPRPSLREGMRTNSAGMRATRDFSLARVPGVPRIGLVGDSLTLGATVADPDAFHTVLGELAAGFEVLNFGVAGYGADQAILMWEEKLAPYAPDVVVLGLYHRDYLRNAMRWKSYAKPFFTLDEGGGLILHRAHVEPPEVLFAAYEKGERRIGGWDYSYVIAAARRVLGQWQRVHRDDPDWRRMAALLRRFRDGVREAGGEPFLLIIPERPEKVPGSEFEDIDRLALEEARALGLPAHSLTASFHADPDAERTRPLFRADGHLTEAGNCEMARALATALAREGLVPPAVGLAAAGHDCAARRPGESR